ncbi:MAG: response regulator [Chryseolinea sp.]
MRLKEFGLREILNSIVLELNEIIGDKNIVRLFIEDSIPNAYQGQSSPIIQPVTLASAFIGANLVNGILLFELKEWSKTGNEVTLDVTITGSGTNESKISPQYKSDAQLVQQFKILSSSYPQISFSAENGEMIAKVKLTLELKDKNSSSASSQFHNKRVLIVEDNEVNVLVFTSFMEGWGISVECAYNGEDGVEMAWTGEYNAILMDIYMPKLCGVEATRKIREFNDKIPVIALSASALDQDKKNAFDAGVNEYLSKPLSSDTLFNVLTKFL